MGNNGFGSLNLRDFSTTCPHWEKITWHNADRNQSIISIDGWDMEQATNLKEIYMDDSAFDREGQRDKLLDLENDVHSNIFLLYKCSTKLERVSIRNAKWYDYGIRDTTVIPQNALIKFVRK